jgi:hypothetical protein
MPERRIYRQRRPVPIAVGITSGSIRVGDRRDRYFIAVGARVLFPGQ